MITLKYFVNVGVVGLSITYALSVTRLLSGVVDAAAETEKQFISVERIGQYLEGVPREIDAPNVRARAHATPDVDESSPLLAHENPALAQVHTADADADVERLAAWPLSPDVRFERVSLRYRPGLPLALDSLSLTVRAGERLGIVGRTGSGKTSLLALLFRLVTPEFGRIFVGEMDIARVPLATLRYSFKYALPTGVLKIDTVNSEHEIYFCMYNVIFVFFYVALYSYIVLYSF